VVALAEGKSAVALCATRSLDLAVFDIGFPGIPGWETAAHIREQTGQDIMIVRTSASADEFHRPEYGGALLRTFCKCEATADAPALAGEVAEAAHGTLPPAALLHVERLHERIRIDHVRGIEAEITLLAEAAPNHVELIAQLSAAPDKIGLPGMARGLEGE